MLYWFVGGATQQHRFNSYASWVKASEWLIVLENVFADLAPQINATYTEKTEQTPKRNAFVFITATPDSGKSALEDLKKVEGVNEVYLSRGAYDFIVKVSGESLDHLREIVFKRIKNLSNIKTTLTLMVV